MEAVQRIVVAEKSAGTWMAFWRLARPHQWIKNLLVLAALVFARRMLIWHDDLLALGAFAAYCALASFAYAVNDIMDREADRLNPEKCGRPIARGDLSIGAASLFAAITAAVGLGISFSYGWGFLLTAVAYVELQFAYSMWAKRVVILDVIAVAIGFVLRAYAGGVAIGVPVSPWLVFITFSLALFLALSRRRHEMAVLGKSAASHRGALSEYSIRMIDQMLAIVAGATLVGYMIYTASPDLEARLGARYHQFAVLTVPYVAFGIMRYLYLVDERGEGGDPARLLLKDRQLMVDLLLWIATEIFLLYF